MHVTAVIVVAAAVFCWSAASARLERADLTAPIVFVVVGAAMSEGGLVDAPTAPETIKPLVEITLVWILFCDAARVRLGDLRADAGRYARLLGIGLPLTVAAGWAIAVWLLPGLDGWTALLVAAALAPTDAALGVPVVTNPAVPPRVRRLITVESGLNDGIATPVVVLAITGAASAEHLSGAVGLSEAVIELAVGVGVGVAVGAAGGTFLEWAADRRWAAPDMTGVAVLALALACYATSLGAHGNGFIAAFCGGLAFGAVGGRRQRSELAFLEQVSGLVSLLVWLGFGAAVVPFLVHHVTAATVGYAVLSLTVVRMVPVAIACLGAHLGRPTVLFVGWFGPRGLASLVFGLLALEELRRSDAQAAVAVIAVTVILSVVAHGISAGPLAARYGRTVGSGTGDDLADLPVRGLPRRRPGPR